MVFQLIVSIAITVLGFSLAAFARHMGSEQWVEKDFE
jgi:hypothetical protein